MEGRFYLPMLPNIARKEHIFSNVKFALVYIGELCDAGCTVTFNLKDVTVIYKEDIILIWWRNHHNKL